MEIMAMVTGLYYNFFTGTLYETLTIKIQFRVN